MFSSTAVATAVATAVERHGGKRVVFPEEVALLKLHFGKTACVLVDLPHSPYFTPRQLECICSVVRIGDEDPTGPTAAN